MVQNLENWDKEDVNEEIQKAGDPLESLRQEKGYVRPMSGSYNKVDERMSLDQEESFLLDMKLKNDPDQGYFKTREDILTGDDIYDNMLPSTDIDDVVLQDLRDEYFLANNNESILPKEIEDDFEPSFEDRAILSEAIEENKKRKQKMFEKLPEIIPEEFALMEECAKFRSISRSTEKLDELTKNRPQFPDGKLLTDEQVKENADRWLQANRDRKLHDNYIPKEQKFMQECYNWNFWYQKLSKNQKNPVFTDTNEPLSDNQIKELANEYKKLKYDNPEFFAELKVESGEWRKKELVLKEKTIKGVKEWSGWCYVEINGTTRDVKYVSYDEPIKKQADFYYTIKRVDEFNSKKYNEPTSVVTIDIKYPAVIKKEPKQNKKASIAV